jgi:hypothetical protein
MTVRYKLIQVPEEQHEQLRVRAFVNRTTITAEAELALRVGLEQCTAVQAANVPQQAQPARVSA